MLEDIGGILEMGWQLYNDSEELLDGSMGTERLTIGVATNAMWQEIAMH